MGTSDDGPRDGDLSSAERAVVERGRAWIRDHETELLELLSELVARPSVTGTEGTYDDTDSVVGYLYSHLQEWSSDANIATQRIAESQTDGSPRDNCYAILEGTGDQLFVCTSHTDTVAPGAALNWPNNSPYRLTEGTVRHVDPGMVELAIDGTVERRAIRDAYDRIWERRQETEREVFVGRGAYDNKASIVCLVGALAALERALEDRQLGGTLLHGHLVGEEISQVGAKAMVGWGDRPDWIGERYPDHDGTAVVMEGSYGFVPAVGHRGLAWITLRAEGASTHASTPHLGTNAVLGTANALTAMDEPSFRTSIADPLIEDQLLGDLTVAAGTTIVGGDVHRDQQGGIDRAGVNSIPDWCETTFDVRFPRWENYPDGLNEIRDHFVETVEIYANRQASDVSFTVTLDPDEFFPPVALAESRRAARDHPLVAQAIETTKSTAGYDPGVTVAPGVTDAATIYPATRFPTLVEYGPAGAWSHEPLEFVERESVIDGAEAMLELAIRNLGLA